MTDNLLQATNNVIGLNGELISILELSYHVSKVLSTVCIHSAYW